MQRVPIVPVHQHAEMAHRHGLAVNAVPGRLAHLLGGQMRDDLVTEQVEVDPVVRRPTFRTPQQPAIETARGGQIIDREGKVKTWHAHGRRSFDSRACVAPP